MMNAPTRKQAVTDLVRLRRPLDDALAELRRFPWDSDEELVELGPTELRHALNRYLAGDLTAEGLEDWANAIEGRDDIAFTPQDIIDLITELANPLLYRSLTPENVRDLASRIDTLTQSH